MTTDLFRSGEADRRAQKEWVFKLKSTATLLARSAAQAQRNFDQYVTAMEHVAALYKDYGSLLSSAEESFLGIQVDIPELAEVKARTARMHSLVHKWEHSESLYQVRSQLHAQSDVLRSRSVLASKAFDDCVEYETLMSTFFLKDAKRRRKLRKKSDESEELQKECDKMEKRIEKVKVTMQRDLETVAAKSTASLQALTSQFFKAMYKNGQYVEKHFHPDRIGTTLDSPASFADLHNDDAVTGMLNHPRSPNSEMSSFAASGIYGVNMNRYYPQEAAMPNSAPQRATQNSGIPLRYDADPAATSAAASLHVSSP